MIVKYGDGDNPELANEIILEAGQNFYVYPGLRHQMLALEDSELLEFSTEHFDADSYRVKKGD
jgi:quercetin dioxygenase-like cupin family protein